MAVDRYIKAQQDFEKLSKDIRKLGKNIEEIGVASGTSFDKANEAFTNLRETMNLTNEQALKLLPSVITQAAGANTSLSTFSKAFGDYMRNMNVPLEDANKIMEQFSFASGNMGVNLEKAGPHMAKMAEAARRWGYEGTKGSAVIMSMLAESSKIYGSSDKGARASINLLQELGSDELGKKMMGPYTQTYLPMGELLLTFDSPGTAGPLQVKPGTGGASRVQETPPSRVRLRKPSRTDDRA